MTRQYRNRTAQRSAWLACALGWGSIALGVIELAAPRLAARRLGLRPGAADVLRLHGLREIAAGVGILRAQNAAPWLWARVGGDMLDLATLAGGADRRQPGTLGRAGLAAAGVAAVTALDAYAAQSYKQPRRQTHFDYSDRSGFPRPPQQMRGMALQQPRHEAAAPAQPCSTEPDTACRG